MDNQIINEDVIREWLLAACQKVKAACDGLPQGSSFYSTVSVRGMILSSGSTSFEVTVDDARTPACGFGKTVEEAIANIEKPEGVAARKREEAAKLLAEADKICPQKAA